MASFTASKTGVKLKIVASLVTIAILARTWAEVVSHYVPEPYLDEVFHIPQAQKYCEGKFSEWDDKITTPPGLYILSLLIPKNLVASSLSGMFSCDALSLRGVNALALVVLANLALLSRWQLELRLHGAQQSSALKTPSQYAIHTAFNIALCPIVFFFSGLYYTDVASTATVLAAFLNSLHRMAKDKTSISSDLLAILIGLLSLFMRQTNVFWSVVFCGGLEAVHAVKTLRPTRVNESRDRTVWGKVKLFASRYSVGDVHDLPAHMAYTDDYVITTVSLAFAAISNPVHVTRQIWPYITTLAAFAGFIMWNGGVVLGDKSNHVATIHLAQMLYIWPFFAFFSLPLVLPYAIQVAWSFISTPVGVAASLQSNQTHEAQNGPSTGVSGNHGGSTLRQRKPLKESSAELQRSNPKRVTKSTELQTQSWVLQTLTSICQNKVTEFIYTFFTVVVSVAVVRYNTIIHPFTLADNRHYMFYVFRYSIRRSAIIRYGLVLAYTVSRWLVWGTLTGSSSSPPADYATSMDHKKQQQPPFACHPLVDHTGCLPAGEAMVGASNMKPEETQHDKREKVGSDLYKDPLRYLVSTSTTLIFILATALSLITAPLVEPRYFIIPWVIWRLLVPAWRLETVSGSDSKPGSPFGFLKGYDARLLLETAWFLAINILTMYVFLFKPYQWRAEDGTLLNDGRWQRFMW